MRVAEQLHGALAFAALMRESLDATAPRELIPSLNEFSECLGSRTSSAILI